jgi:hypothetical protein
MEHVVTNAQTGQTTVVPFTAEEEAAALARLPDPKIFLSDYTAQKRRDLVNGYALIDVGERSIPTWVDPESRGAITGLVVASGIVPDLTAPWKGADGHFYQLTTSEIVALALGMMQFVQDAFAVEATLIGAIGSGVITQAFQIDGANWPNPGF